MIALADVRAALADALRAADYNVSDGGDLVANGAAIGPFVCNYHTTIQGQPSGMSVAGVEVRIVTDRADEASAYSRLDDAMSTLWHVIEQSPGPWRSIHVQSARPDSPLVVGEASFASLALIIELYV